MRELRGLAFLGWLTFRRQLAARKTAIAIVLLGMLCLATIVWSRHFHNRFHGEDASQQIVRLFAQAVIMPVYVTGLLPVLSLIYATAALGEERDERTLVYTLIRPLSRYRVYVAKGLGILPMVLLAGLGGYALMCRCAGPEGPILWNLFLPAIARGCIAYTSLFLLFGALFPRPLVFAVCYSFFCETLLGNMPGTIKRLAISYHCRCLMFDSGAPYGIEPASSLQFLPISGSAAAWSLDLASVALLAIGAYFFHRKEFNEFT